MGGEEAFFSYGRTFFCMSKQCENISYERTFFRREKDLVWKNLLSVWSVFTLFTHTEEGSSVWSLGRTFFRKNVQKNLLSYEGFPSYGRTFFRKKVFLLAKESSSVWRFSFFAIWFLNFFLVFLIYIAYMLLLDLYMIISKFILLILFGNASRYWYFVTFENIILLVLLCCLYWYWYFAYIA